MESSGMLASKPWTVIGAFIGLSLLYVVSKVVYSLYLHPLANIPGPKLAAISRVPYIRHLLRGTTHRNVQTLHEQYGEVVRISPNEVSFSSGETAWPDIYGFRTGKMKGHANMAKNKAWYPPPPLNGAPSLLIANDEDHSRGRRIVAHAFSERALSGQEQLIQNYVDQLISGLKETITASTEETGSAKVDMATWYNWTTFDVIADLSFGAPFGCLRDRVTHKYMHLLLSSLAGLRFFYVINYWPWVKRLRGLIIDPKLLDARLQYIQWVAGQTKARVAKETDRADFITYILKHNDDKEKGGLTDDEMVANALLFLSAGSETTATLLSGATYLLLRNPEVMQKLKSEVRGTFKTYDDITLQAAFKQPYLLAVLDEALRYFPPVPTGFERTVGPGGEVISGHFIPEDTGVCVSSWPTHHSASNFKNPNKFLPERWMGDAEYADDKRASCQPFAFGPRNCLGKNLALAEMRLIMAKIIWSFDLELDAKSANWIDDCKVFTVWNKPELTVHVKEVVRD